MTPVMFVRNIIALDNDTLEQLMTEVWLEDLSTARRIAIADVKTYGIKKEYHAANIPKDYPDLYKQALKRSLMEDVWHWLHGETVKEQFIAETFENEE